jgi:uncharacterized protein
MDPDSGQPTGRCNQVRYNVMTYNQWEKRFRQFIYEECNAINDSAHDLTHIQRVVAAAKKIGTEEKADPKIYIPAAWLHDCVVLPKNHPDRSNASTIAADKAIRYLSSSGYNEQYLDSIHHAIQAHSFSAGIKPETTEARVAQDADRLDALGAVGIARCLMTGGKLGRSLYHPGDPFCENREPDDLQWTIDHFYQKLFKLPESMQTASGKKEANRRVEVMKSFLEQLRNDI